MTEDIQETLFQSEFQVVDISLEPDEAFSAVTINPAVTWVKFILTDDQPNANRQRVPADEFGNLIKSGMNMPIKMASGGINTGHEGSTPIGAITHLKQLKNQIIGLAALWARERPEDVNLIKERFSNKEPLELSWEILYSNSSTTEDGITDLKDTALRAVTFVGRPAFEGRTPVLAVAAKTDNNPEETNLEELETLKNRVAELESLLAEKDSAFSSKETELSALNSELVSLREFKAAVEKEQADNEKLVSIRNRFAESGISKDDTYFVENKQTLLAMSDTALEFMIQELVAFSSVAKESVASKKDVVQAPVLTGKKSKDFSPAELGALLRDKQLK